MSAFTPEQEQRLREIVREEMNDRFGVALTPEQWRAVWAEWDRCKAMADEAQLRLERATQDGSALRIVGEDGPEISAGYFDDDLVAKVLKKVSADGLYVRGERPPAPGSEDV